MTGAGRGLALTTGAGLAGDLVVTWGGVGAGVVVGVGDDFGTATS